MSENPNEGERVTLLVGIDGATSKAIPHIEEVGGNVVEELPFNTLKVEISTADITRLEDTPGIESIERDEEGQIQGNLYSPRVSSR